MHFIIILLKNSKSRILLFEGGTYYNIERTVKSKRQFYT